MTPRRILLVRTDRIGDVVLTLPMVDVILERAPGSTVSMLVREYTRELAEHYPGVEKVFVVGEKGGLGDLRRAIRMESFDAVIHVFPRPDLSWLTFRAGIRERVGTSFRWFSFLYNRRIPDHRKRGGLHEAILNVRLLRGIGIDPPATVLPRLYPTSAHAEAAKRVSVRAGLQPGKPFVVLHPGSGGSARDWRIRNFVSLARELASRGLSVVVTGGEHEIDLADRVVRESGGRAVSVAGDLSLMELGAFVSKGALFISNSTGPLHIAAAVGTPVIGFFPPLESAGVGRWGPLGEHAETFTPEKERCELCLGGECRGNTCMDQITVGAVAKRALETIQDHSKDS